MPRQILLVDDSVTVHKVVAITFAREDVVLTMVKSADEGIAKAREIKPDIVLADGNLAGKSGYDVCAALRGDPATANVACLILTGNFSPYDEARGQKAGADGFVVKPFETQAMIDKTNDAINKKKGGASVAAAAPAPAPAPMATAPTMAMPLISTTPPAPPKPAAPQAATMMMEAPKIPAAPAPPPLVPPKPVSPPVVAVPPARDDSVEISIDAPPAPHKPAPPLVPPAPPPLVVKPAAPVTPPPAPKPMPIPAASPKISPPAAPQASTMMMDAPKIPAAPVSPKETPQASTMMMEAPKVPPVSPKETPQASTMMMEAPKVPPPAVKPVPSPTGRMQVTMPASVPQMPRPSLIPNVATPAAAAATPPQQPQRGAPRATIMGMPVIGQTPGTPLVPPAPTKPAVQAWAPPRTTSTGMKAINPAELGIEMPKPEPAAPQTPIQKEMSPLVAAVAERASAQVDLEIAAAGGDPQQLKALSREVIEKIAWEVVPELAEVILKENADKLKK